MANIFGKTVKDYSYIAKNFDAKMQDAMVKQDRKGKFNLRPVKVNDSVFRDQTPVAQALQFMTNNFEAIQAEQEEILYTMFRLPEYIPIKQNIPEGAQSYAYRVMNRTGRGRFIDRSGKDAPNAGVTQGKVSYNLEYGGIIPEWNLDELRTAIFGGVSLDNEIISSAMDGAMNHIQDVGILGDTEYKLTGLVNMPNVPIENSSATWANLDNQTIINNINSYVTKVIQQTEEVMGRNLRPNLALYLPTTQFGRLTQRLDNGMDSSMWRYISQNNAWTQRTGNPISIRSVLELMGAGASGEDRMLVGFPDESRIWEMGMPIQPRVIDVQSLGYTVSAPIEYKISGLNVKRPEAMLYVDGI